MFLTIATVSSIGSQSSSFFSSLTPSDWIQICGIIAPTITSIVAIKISIDTLRQNNKMIEESTRPNIQIYPVYLNSLLYIIIKNFGASEAIIDEVKCSHKFTEAEYCGDINENGFEKLHGAIFCPGYALRCPLVAHSVTNETFQFEVSYHSSEKKYHANFAFNPYSNAPFADTYPSGNSTENHLKHIANELHDIVKMKL